MAEPVTTIAANSFVLYRGKPARVARTGERIELELEGGETARVRAKDVDLLHPGPLSALAALLAAADKARPQPDEVHAAWEILAGGSSSCAEVAELAFGDFTPLSAWQTWQLVAEGLYFSGTPERIVVATAEELQQRLSARESAAAEERAWKSFLERAKMGKTTAEDWRYLKEVEPLAYGAPGRSRLLRELGRSDTPESAHALLLDCGAWTEQVDPYPRRMGMPLRAPALAVPALPEEPRRDLTGLPAFAIDDAGTDNPDDALSLDGDTIWVHVADPGAVATPDSPLDLEARARGSTLHLPEGAIHLFPNEMTAAFGLGLREISPALSFAIRLGAEGEVSALEIVPSWVRVRCLTYEEANLRMEEMPFAGLETLATLRRERRTAAGSSNIDLPEAKLHVSDGQVEIHPVRTLRSRLVVEEAMILVGEAVARYALEKGIPLPFSQQEPPDQRLALTTPAGMFAMRRMMRRSQHRVTPGAHSGLGLALYAQSTSPLRRYLDLVVHQQLRASLRGGALIDGAGLLERIGAVEAAGPALRSAEQLAERHWTLVYLLQHPGWSGEGVLVEKRGATGTVIVPELALEARVHLVGDPALDSILTLSVGGIHLPNLDVTLLVQR